MKKLQQSTIIARLSARALVLTTAVVAACAFLPFAACADAKLPLIVWGTLPESEATAARYAEAKEAGFTHVVQWCASADAAKRILGEAEKAGKDYFMVVNRNPNDDMAFKAKFAPGSEIVRRDGTRAKLDAYSDIFWLDPGDAAIFSAP